MILYGPGTAKPDAILAIYFASDPTGDRIRLKAMKSDYATPEDAMAKEVYHPVGYVWLPLPSLLSFVLRGVLAAPGQPLVLDQPQKLCTLSPALSHSVSDVLEELDPSGRLSLSAPLDDAGEDLGKDLRRPHAFQPLAGPKAPFAQFRVVLRRRATTAPRRSLPGGNRVMIRSTLPDWTYPSKPVEEFIPGGFAGARNTPIRPELIAEIALIRALALRFFDFRPDDWDLSNPEFVCALNMVSAWVTLRVGYACGIRAIKSPLPWAHNIHPVLLIVNWRDKDNRSGYHTRILWVPEDVRDELARYQGLLLQLCKKLGLAAEWRKVPGFFIDARRRGRNSSSHGLS